MPETAIELDPALGWKLYAEKDPFTMHVGPIWHRFTADSYESAFVVQPVHCNIVNVLHGGMLSTFADTALGYAALSSDNMRPNFTIHLEVSFIAAARLGERVHCRTEMIRKTRSLFFMRGTFTVETRCIATASGVWKIQEARA